MAVWSLNLAFTEMLMHSGPNALTLLDIYTEGGVDF